MKKNFTEQKSQKEAIARSVSEFVHIVSESYATLVKNGLDKNEIPLFRGQSDVDYRLLPSIGRDRASTFSVTIFNEERNLIDAAKYKMPDVFSKDLSPIELLALLQHHGIPTRLLDVTENALVALYFACCDKLDKDGEVFVFKHNEIDITNYPLIEAIADSYRFAKDSLCDIKRFYQQVREQPYFLEQRSTLDAINQMPQEDLYKAFQANNLGEYIAKMCENPLFVYAPIRSLRQQMQRGRYILFPNSIEDWKVKDDLTIKVFATKMNPIPKDHGCIIGKYTIPADSKKSIMQDLKLFGISEESLFCDNIDVVCKNIKHSFQDKVKGDSLCLT